MRREAENKICTAIRNKTEQIYYGMGNIVFLPEQIEKSLARASIIMDYCMFAEIEPQEIARESSIAGNKSIMDLTTEFVDVVTDTHSKIDLKTEVDHLLNDLMNGELSIEQIKWICADMIYNIHYKILNEYNIQIESIIMQNNISKSLLSVNKLDDFRKFLNQTLESIREYIGVYHQDGSSSVINRIKQYIQSNINKQFTLEEISDKFYLNPAYVSYIFKKETGINLFSYIAEQRIFKAKHLLRNTNMKIADIALEIGYRDQRYFCQVFKQKCGITASEYRENYGENKGKYS